MATGYVQLARENTPGNETVTPTLSTKKLFPPLESFQPTPNAAHMRRDGELRNTDEPVPDVTEAHNPSLSWECRAYPDGLGFFLSWMLGDPVTTAGNGIITDPDATVIPVGATRHVWTAPFGPAGASPKTADAKIAYKDQGFFLNAKGAAVASLEMATPESGGMMLRGSGPCLFLNNIADPALSPTIEADTVLPFERAFVTIGTWLAATGDADDFTLNIENPVEPKHTLGGASRWPDKMYKGDGPIVCSFTMPKELIDLDDWNALIAATGFATKVKWVSTQIIASGYPYKLFVESGNAQYTDGEPDPLTNRRRIGGSFQGRFTRTGSTPSATITLVNSTASYA